MLKYFTLYVALIGFLSSSYAAELEDYTRIYHKQCATCHGNNGDGQGRAGVSLSPVPTNFTSAASRQRLSINKITLAIRDGVPGTAMSAYGRRFNAEMLAGLANYVHGQFIAEKIVENTSSDLNHKGNGKAIYVKHCSACHGDNGNTAVWAKNALNPAPRNFTSPQAKEELSLERMITSVTYGRPGTAMMSFKKRLNEQEINAVVEYIRHTFMNLSEKSKPAESLSLHTALPPSVAIDPVDMDLPFPKKLQGNAMAGKQFFQNNCFTCHGKKGDGKGPRSHFNFPRPRDFTSLESRQILNRPRLFKGISRGKPRTVMPAWSTVLTAQEIANVGEYVFQQFVHPSLQKKKP